MYISEDVSYILDLKIDKITIGDTYTPAVKAEYKYYNYGYSRNEQAKLSSISFPNGSMSFNYSNRLDLEPVDNTKKAKKLDAIAINNTNESIRNIAFKYSYLGSTEDPLSCRLMLDSLRINDQNYAFSYDRTGSSLPSKNSMLTDYWGYYNGTLIPTEDQSFKLSPPVKNMLNKGPKFFPGMNKQSQENYMKYGILTSIQYPTGGKTTFDYEMHTFQNSFNTYERVILKETGANFSLTSATEQVSEDFVVSGEAESAIDILCHNLSAGILSTPVTVYIDRKQGSAYQNVQTYSFNYYSNLNSETKSYEYTFNPGTYRIKLSIPQTCAIAINVSAKSIVSKDINSGGGLRIKTIRDEIDNTHSIQKEFSYQKSGTSTGLLMTKPQHHLQYTLITQHIPITYPGVAIDTYEAIYINGFSTSFTPFGNSAMGENIGYSYVTEKITGTDNNGLTAYTFFNKADSIVDLSDRYIKGYPSIPYLNNGSSLEICYFDKDNTLKKKERFEYAKTKTDFIKGVKIFRAPMANEGMNIKFYDLYSERWVLNRKIDSLLLDNKWLTTSVNYLYNNANWLVNNEKTNDSSGNLLEKRFLYPNDYNSEPYNSMANQKILSPVIEQSKYKNSGFLQKTITEYKNWGNGIFAPEFVKAQTQSQTNPEIRIKYYNYDGYGNSQYLFRDDADKVVYLWGYNGMYPIAKIQNASYSQVEQILTSQLINRVASAYIPPDADLTAIKNLRTNANLSGAMVTVYEYRPLVGILKMTDPRGIVTDYVYDDFGRLIRVLVDGKKEKEYNYHYKE